MTLRINDGFALSLTEFKSLDPRGGKKNQLEQVVI